MSDPYDEQCQVCGVPTGAIAALERELAEARGEITRLNSWIMADEVCIRDLRTAIEALGESPSSADLWADMKDQRDQALADVKRLTLERDRLKANLRNWTS